MSSIATTVLLASCVVLAGEPPKVQKPDVQKGTVKFEPKDDQKNVPKNYRLEAHTFDFEMNPKSGKTPEGVEAWQVRFPSPIESPHKENNTVHAEFYRPKGKGPFPGVVVLDITQGNQVISRTTALQLAQNGVAGLVVYMAYYGPRQPPNSKVRMVSTDYARTMAAIKQTVLDVRRASAWLESRPEIDGKNIGIAGVSLGSFIGTLAAEMEPRFTKVASVLGGGGLMDAYYDHPRAAPYTQALKTIGISKKALNGLIAPVDPITCAANLKDRKLLIIAAKRDDIVPPKAAEALWNATGKQQIIWYDSTHVGSVLYVVPIMTDLVNHFATTPLTAKE